MPAIKREMSHPVVTNVPETRTSRSGRALKAPAMYEPATAASRKGKRATKKEANITCVKCHRGSSPSNNMIVFCDGCNETWHQKCHDPMIDDHVVQVADAEWRCHKCKPAQEPATAPQKGNAPALQNENMPAPLKGKASASQKERAPAPRKGKAPNLSKATAPASQKRMRKPFAHPRLGRAGAPPRFCKGEEYSIDARRAYLSQLSHAELVELAVNVSIENSHIAMFPRDMGNYFKAGYKFPTQHHLATPAASNKRRIEDSEEPQEATNAAKRAKTMPPPATKPAVRPNTRSHSTTALVETGRNHKRVLTTTTIPKTLQDRIDQRLREDELHREWSMGQESVSLSTTKSTKSEPSEASLPGIQDHRQYPAAGNGFTLPSRPEDLDILQEAEDCPTFSYSFNAARKNLECIREMLRRSVDDEPASVCCLIKVINPKVKRRLCDVVQSFVKKVKLRLCVMSSKSTVPNVKLQLCVVQAFLKKVKRRLCDVIQSFVKKVKLRLCVMSSKSTVPKVKSCLFFAYVMPMAHQLRPTKLCFKILLYYTVYVRII
ncbi:hypothetical protein N7451_008738 [Penicillium sp. IBT 35674x]|nr:hypothetical protein N7451_008738 [Penicillium sp. IBT 35674x]